MNTKLLNIIFISTAIIFFSSCKATQNMYLLKDYNSQSHKIDSLKLSAIPKIQKGDRVSIIVSCADPSQTSFLNPFNIQNPGTNSNQNSIGYLVDSMGYIDFPLVGKKKIESLNSHQAAEAIKADLKSFFKDPYVYVTLVGKVFVVNGRGGYNVNMNNERLTILEALAQPNSYEPDDLWNEVLVIREENGIRTLNTIDLTSKEVLNSPYYYLKSNDLVYVKPGKLNANLKATNNVRSSLSLATGILAIIILLIKK